MRTHQVEIDDEVFSFVKSQAEPLVDTFNSVIRRLLSLDDSRSSGRKQRSETHLTNVNNTDLQVPSGIPQALRQIIEVIHLVRGGAYTRTAATQFVAKKYHVFPQTVLDKYCRQLQLTANQFDRLLEKKDYADLRKLLKSKFENHSDVIDSVLK